MAVLLKSTDFLRRIIVLVEGQGGVTLSYVCPHCHRVPIEDYIWFVSRAVTAARNGKTLQLVLRGMRRPVQLELPEQSLGKTELRGPQRGEGVPG